MVTFVGVVRCCLAIAFSVLTPIVSMAQTTAPEQVKQLEVGRRIYTEGVRASGAELQGTRAGRAPVTGSDAACVNCHRPSGMGQVESDIQIPPINGNYLFAPRTERRVATMDPHVSKLFNQAHDPYTDASLASAVRQGVNANGREMNVLMPRFNLSDSELQALTVYLKQLSQHWSPGVSETNVRFATVITPDVDPVRRKVMIDMMRAIVRQKNSSTMTAVPTSMQNRTRHHMTTAAELMLGTERTWDLDVWELQGAPDSWGEQLAAFYRRQPVFALVSGLGNSTWQPVHDFCAGERVPCMFPSVDLPGKALSPYAFYFSGGVTLESAVLSRHLMDQKQRPGHVVQIYRDDDTGHAAAQALTQALAGTGIRVSDHVLSADLSAVDALRQALDKVKHDDTVMFWLRPDDMAALVQITPVASKNYFSGGLAKGEHAPLPVNWRTHSLLVYPYELPENRTKNLDYFHVWLNLRKIPLVDEIMQSEVFFTLNFMTDMLSEMLDNVYGDYLVERAETMLSKREGAKAEQETRDRVFLGQVGDLTRKRGVSTIEEPARIKIQNQPGNSGKSAGTTVYPHLSLGPNQRFASKSAYIVRFVNGSGKQLAAESGLIVP